MYLPTHFKEARSGKLHALMREYPFASVIAHDERGVSANHLPLELIDGTHLHGHVARGNELAKLDGAQVLVIFHGPDGYVSPNWYPSKRETHREVPTWNYAVVHVHGRLRTTEDAAWLRRLLERLTDHHEAGMPEPWRVSDAPDDHIEKMLNGITGLDIEIDRIEGKFKLSQNHPAANRAGVVAGLQQRASRADAGLADLMSQQEEGRS